MEQYRCTECQKKLNLSDVSGVRLDGWTWWSLRNYFYQVGLFSHLLLAVFYLVTLINWLLAL